MSPKFGMDEPAASRSKSGIDDSAIAKRIIGFKTGKHELLDGHKLYIKNEVIPNLRTQGVVLDIVGHASRRQFSKGSKDSNEKLSNRRTKAVFDFMMPLLVGGAKIRSVGVGDTLPIGEDVDDEKDRAVVCIIQNAIIAIPRIVRSEARRIDFPETPPLRLPELPLVGSVSV